MSASNILIGVRKILQNHVIDCSQILPENSNNIFEVLINTSRIHADVVKNNKRITEYREHYGLVLAQNCYNFLLQQGSIFWTDVNEKDAFDFWKFIIKRLSDLSQQEKSLFGTIALDWFRILEKTSEKVSKLRLPIISTLSSHIIELFTSPNLPIRNTVGVIEEWNKCLKIPRSYTVKQQIFQDFKETFHKVGEIIQKCGDYQMQSSLIECVLHYSGFSNSENLSYLAEHWFSDVKHENIKKSFMRTCFKDFQLGVREFLNNLNINETFQDVCSVEGALVEIDGKETISSQNNGKFWIDFNFGSGCISLLCGIFPTNKWTVLNIYNDFVNFVMFTIDTDRKYCKASMKLKMNFKENLIVSKYTKSNSEITLHFSADIKPDLCRHLLLRMFQPASVPICDVEVKAPTIPGKASLNDNTNTSQLSTTSTSDSAMNLYARLNSCDQNKNPFKKPSKSIVRSPELSTVFETDQENLVGSSNKAPFFNVEEISPESSCRSLNSGISYDAFDTMQETTSAESKILNLNTSEFVDLNASSFLDNSKSVISNSQLEIPESDHCDESDGEMKRFNKRNIMKVSRSVQELRDGKTKEYLFSQTDASGNVVYEKMNELVNTKKVSISNGLSVEENKKRNSVGDIVAIGGKRKKYSAPRLNDISRLPNVKKSLGDSRRNIKFSQCDTNVKTSGLMTDFFNQKIKLTKSVPSATITKSNSVLSLVDLNNDEVTSVYVEKDLQNKLREDTRTIEPIAIHENNTVINNNILADSNIANSSANKNNSNENIVYKQSIHNNDAVNITSVNINNINSCENNSTINNNTVIINKDNNSLIKTNVINNEGNNQLINNIVDAIINIEESFDENLNDISIIPTSQKVQDKIVNDNCPSNVIMIESSDDERDGNCNAVQDINSTISSNRKETSIEYKTVFPLISMPDYIEISSDDECIEIPLDVNTIKVNPVQKTIESKDSVESVQKSLLQKDEFSENQTAQLKISEKSSLIQEISLQQNEITLGEKINTPDIPMIDNHNENNLQGDPKTAPEIIHDFEICPSRESQIITEKSDLVDKNQISKTQCTVPLVLDNQNLINQSENHDDQSKLDDLTVDSFVLDENTPPDGSSQKKKKRKLEFKIQSPTTILKQISDNFPKRQSLREELSRLSQLTPAVSLVSIVENRPLEKTSKKKTKKRKSLKRSCKQKFPCIEKTENQLALEKQALQERLDCIQLSASTSVTKEKSQLSNNLADDTINSEIYNQVTQPVPIHVQDTEIPTEETNSVFTPLNLPEVEVLVSRTDEYVPVTKEINIPIKEPNVPINKNDSIEKEQSHVQVDAEIITSGNLPVYETSIPISPINELTCQNPDVTSHIEVITENSSNITESSNKNSIEEISAESISEISSVASRRKRLYSNIPSHRELITDNSDINPESTNKTSTEEISAESISETSSVTVERLKTIRRKSLYSPTKVITENSDINPESTNKTSTEERSAESISEISSFISERVKTVRRKRLYSPAAGFEMEEIPNKRSDQRKTKNSRDSSPQAFHPCFLLVSPDANSSGRYSLKSPSKANNNDNTVKKPGKRGRKKKVTEVSTKHEDYVAPKIQAPRDKVTYSYKNLDHQSPKASTSKEGRTVYSQFSELDAPVIQKKSRKRKKKIGNRKQLDVIENVENGDNTESNGQMEDMVEIEVSQREGIPERELIQQREGILQAEGIPQGELIPQAEEISQSGEIPLREEIPQVEETVQTVTKIHDEEKPKKKVRARRRKQIPQIEREEKPTRLTSRGRVVPLVSYQEFETSFDEFDQTEDFEQTRDNPVTSVSSRSLYSPDGSEFIPSPRYMNKSPFTNGENGIDRIKSSENINDITASSGSMIGRLIIETVNEIPAKPDWNLSLSISLSDLEISPRSIPPEICDGTSSPRRSSDLRSRSTLAEGSMNTEEINNPKVTTGESQTDCESFNFDKMSNLEEALVSKMPNDPCTDEFTEKVVQSMAYIIESCVPAELNKHNATYTIAVDESIYLDSDVEQNDCEFAMVSDKVSSVTNQNDDLASRADILDKNLNNQENVILNNSETNTRINSQTTTSHNNYEQLREQPKQAQNLVQSSIDVFTQKSRRKVEQLDVKSRTAQKSEDVIKIQPTNKDKETSRVCELDRNVTSDQNSNVDIVNLNDSPSVKSTNEVVECIEDSGSRRLDNSSESVMIIEKRNTLLEPKRNILKISPLNRKYLTQHWLEYNDKSTLRSNDDESYTLSNLCAGFNISPQIQNASPLSVKQTEIRNEDSGNSSEELIVLKNRSVRYNVDMATVTKSLSSMREISQQSTNEHVNSIHISPIKFSLTPFVQPESLADLSLASFYKFELSQNEKNSIGLSKDASNAFKSETSTSGYEATNPNTSFNLEDSSESNLSLIQSSPSEHSSMEPANFFSQKRSFHELSRISSTPKVIKLSQYKTEIKAINIQDMSLINNSMESDLMIDSNSSEMGLVEIDPSTINMDSSISSLPDLNFALRNNNTSMDIGFSGNDISQRFLENGTLEENIENFAKNIRAELEIENEYVTKLQRFYRAFLECKKERNMKLQALRNKSYKK